MRGGFLSRRVAAKNASEISLHSPSVDACMASYDPLSELSQDSLSSGFLLVQSITIQFAFISS